MAERFRVRPLDPRLPAVRDDLLCRLAELVPDAEVFEVGSTAVPGLIGKGDLDVLVRAPAERFEAARAALDGVFPRNPDQLSEPVYQGYTVPSPIGLDLAIQLTVTDGPYDDFLRLLELLRARPAAIAAYNALKRAWDGQDMTDYRRAKSAFIADLLASPADPPPDP